jgi:hypothetical protein
VVGDGRPASRRWFNQSMCCLDLNRMIELRGGNYKIDLCMQRLVLLL